jgi:DNA-binding NarL/FixJ family response regulator
MATMERRIRIVLVEDHALARFTMGYFLNANEDMEVVGEAANGEEGVEAVLAHQPDIVLVDYFLPGINGAETTSRIAQAAPQARVIGISHNDSQNVIDAMRQAGAVAFMTKRSSIPDLMAAIRQAAHP